MATRMQQRRGTAAQWTAANPILAAGEIGFETDTNKFKMGNGTSAWGSLQYFANAAELETAINNLIDAAPDTLNTLNELAAAIGDNPNLFTDIQDTFDLKATINSPEFTGVPTAPTAAPSTNTTQIATTEFVQTKVNNLVNGAPGALDTLQELAAALANDADYATTITNNLGQKANRSELESHAATTENVHGVIDFADLVTSSNLSTSISNSIDTHNGLTTNVHGIANTADLATASDVAVAANAVATNLGLHEAATTSVHGIADTSLLVTQADLENAIDGATVDQSALAGVGIDWNAVSGQYDIDSTVATTAYADQAEADAITAAGTAADTKIADAVAALTKSSVGLDNVDNTSDANKPVSTATQAALDLKANLESPTFTGIVSGITKSMVGLSNVDNTSDLDKPISDATQAALDDRAKLIGATFTGDVTVETNLTVDGNLTVTGTTTTVSAQDLVVSDPLIYIGEGNTGNLVDLGLVSSFNDGTYQHAGIVRDASAGKWKIFKGVTDEPTTTVNFAQGSLDALQVQSLETENISIGSITMGTVTESDLVQLSGITAPVQSQLDDKAPIASPTFTGTVTVSASGVAFSDGTQTKEGTPSRTPIVQKTAAYTLGALTDRDSLIEVSHTGGSAVNVTIPADSTLNFPIGTSIDVLQTNTGAVAIAAGAGVTVNATPGLTLRTQWSSATLFKRAANTWVVYGDLK